jgi:hypothetical protein
VTARTVVILVVLTLLIKFPMSTQGAVGGTISGTVKDRNGAVLPKATVTTTNTDNGFRWAKTANDMGAYSFSSLPVGHYLTSISLP